MENSYMVLAKNGQYHFNPDCYFGESHKVGDITRGGYEVVHVGTLRECEKIVADNNPPSTPLFDNLKSSGIDGNEQNHGDSTMRKYQVTFSNQHGTLQFHAMVLATDLGEAQKKGRALEPQYSRDHGRRVTAVKFDDHGPY